MPLDKSGRVVRIAIVRIADDGRRPRARRYLPAARFLADAEPTRRRDAERAAPAQHRKVASSRLVDRFALIALEFPSFRDGRAYTQARLLRAPTATGASCAPPARCCATSFVSAPRRLRPLEVEKAGDAAAYAEAVGRYSVFYQPNANGFALAQRRRLLGAVAGGERIATTADLAR